MERKVNLTLGIATTLSQLCIASSACRHKTARHLFGLQTSDNKADSTCISSQPVSISWSCVCVSLLVLAEQEILRTRASSNCFSKLPYFCQSVLQIWINFIVSRIAWFDTLEAISIVSLTPFFALTFQEGSKLDARCLDFVNICK